MKNETARREIEALDYYLQNHTNDYGEESHMAMMMAMEALEQQPKTGKWIDEGQYAEGHNEHAYRCSECGEHYIGYVGEFKYCPNCGAKMEVEE